MTSRQPHFYIKWIPFWKKTATNTPLPWRKPLLWAGVILFFISFFLYRVFTFEPKRNAKIPSLRLETNYPLKIELHPEVSEKYPDTYHFYPNDLEIAERVKKFDSKYANEPFRPSEHQPFVILGSGPIALQILALNQKRNPLLLEGHKQLGGITRGEKAGEIVYPFLISPVGRTFELNSSLPNPVLSSFTNITEVYQDLTKKLVPQIQPGQIRTQARVHRVFLTDTPKKIGIIYEDQRGKPVHLTADQLVFTESLDSAVTLTQIPNLSSLPLVIHSNLQPVFHFAMASTNDAKSGVLENALAPLGALEGDFDSKILGNILWKISKTRQDRFLLQGQGSIKFLDAPQARQAIFAWLEELKKESPTTISKNKDQKAILQSLGNVFEKPEFVRMGVQKFPIGHTAVSDPILWFHQESLKIWLATPELSRNTTLNDHLTLANQFQTLFNGPVEASP